LVTTLDGVNDALKGMNHHWDGNIKDGSCGMGLSYRHDSKLWAKLMLTSPFGAARDAYTAHWTWTPCADFVLGGHGRGNMQSPLTNREMTYCAEATFGTPGLRVGGKWDSLFNQWKMTNNVFTAYFNYSRNGRTAGARTDYTVGKGFETKVGLQLEHEDHSWRFRFHNTGMMHAMLKWRLHKTCAASVNTRVNLNDVPKGRINSVPLGLAFHVEY
jgi:hypothetical protein